MQVDLGTVKCALVVCDTQWRDASSEDSTEEHLQAQDYLRLDSMVFLSHSFAPYLPFCLTNAFIWSCCRCIGSWTVLLLSVLCMQVATAVRLS